MKRIVVLLCVCAFAAAQLAGCGSGGPPAPERATASYRALLSAGGGSIAFPTVDGYGATFVYSANDLRAPVAADLVTTAAPALAVPGGAQPPGVQLAAFTFTLGARVTFSQWHRLPTTVTIPEPVVGRAFSIYGYDLTTGVGIGINPGTLAGTTITLPAALGPVSLLPHRYLFILIEQ